MSNSVITPFLDLFDEIREIKSEIKMGRAEDKEKAKESESYSLELVLKDEKNIHLTHFIQEKYHAQWLAKNMMTSIERTR